MTLILYAILIALFLMFSRKKETQTSFFTKNDTTIIKGFSALIVLLHHLGLNFDIGNTYDIFNSSAKAGGVAVGIFFMLSAYGILKSYNNNPTYYKKILFVKIPSLYAFQVAINALYYFIFYATSNLSKLEIFIRIFNLDMFCHFDRINGYSWFITTILCLYLLFALLLMLAQLLKNKIKHNKLFIGVGSTIIVSLWVFIVKFAPTLTDLYYRSVFCFSLGAWLCLYEKQLLSFLQPKKNFIWATAISACLLIFSFFLLYERHIAIATCLLMAILSSKITLGNNQLFIFLGNISLEIYLLQLIFFNKIDFDSELLAGITIIGSTIVLSYMVHLIYTYIKKLIVFSTTIISKSNNKSELL